MSLFYRRADRRSSSLRAARAPRRSSFFHTICLPWSRYARNADPRAMVAERRAAEMCGEPQWHSDHRVVAFFLYGCSRSVFNKLFFPSFDPLVGTLLAFATYAVGFVARPLGGIVFGHFGDRIGRKLLMWSLVMMGLERCSSACCPDTRASACGRRDRAHRAPRGPGLRGRRVGRRRADGGGNSATRNSTDTRHTGRRAARQPAVAGWPALMAADFIAWGWRVPFLLSACLSRSAGTSATASAQQPMFEAAIERPRPIAGDGGVPRAPRAVLLGAGLRVADIGYYILTVFSLTFLVDVASESRSLALDYPRDRRGGPSSAIPLLASLSDRIGRRRLCVRVRDSASCSSRY